jgi:hypothetical protein
MWKSQTARQEDLMILSATLKRDSADGATVRYVDSYGGKHSFLSEAIVIRAADLPDPPPALLRVSLSWYQAPRTMEGQGTGEERAPVVATKAAQPRVAQGDCVKVIKSRKSGVRNPAEWLQQYMGQTGVVLWVTPDGASVSLEGGAVWFSYDELERSELDQSGSKPST